MNKFVYDFYKITIDQNRVKIIKDKNDDITFSFKKFRATTNYRNSGIFKIKYIAYCVYVLFRKMKKFVWIHSQPVNS